MKNYLALAAVLGVIAFAGVSTLVQAEEKAAEMKMEATAPAMAPAPAPAMAPAATPAMSSFAMDNDMCNTMASAPTEGGAAPSAEAKDAAFKACMTGKGHTEEAMKKEMAPAVAPAAAPAPAMEAPKAEEKK